MYARDFLLRLCLVSTIALRVPTAIADCDQGSLYRNVVYWGQNGGNAVENNDLSAYCTSAAGIDIIVLAFLYEYGNGITIPGGSIGQSCSISTSGEGAQCEELAAAIKKCQSNGVKIFISLGGSMGAYSLSSQQEAEIIGQNLWNAYGNTVGNVSRPFGAAFVNGWDFDIETSNGNQYYKYLIDKLRSNFASDPGNEYFISGAPQCPVPEPFMQDIITNAQFDYVWVQFYNNPGCSVNGAINYNAWRDNIAGTSSADAKIFIGIPASPDAATGEQSGAKYYLRPDALSQLVDQYRTDSAFGGTMLWSAGFSDKNHKSRCTYAQEAKNILTTGSPC
ncbi:chitinase 2 [Penicillium citrinum]|uniref:Chitinase 2 n=1 Tax=Penicillium citrinum TaxID=5077 RepID=A0A9W9P9P8_PENCI|nr:chitinase 2 [Penicillium citrinum]KAJ5240330.1 chitinase 2 [Penicillium citrinum]